MKAGGGRQSWQREPEETVFTFSSLSAPDAVEKRKKKHTHMLRKRACFTVRRHKCQNHAVY